ncbi:AAA family ATPase [Saccharopolyspora sp. HNM0983]|uniref:AAA family ATPase n=1 Tax=Saccharopolyspora montiporae TaxID=2781240 RepID=A0A929FYB9_9PSEU|nr:tetratricopeptide repeat protein [Saccharopolyspora sp. HNM0983]MBE9373239.1 AAA family ATPase [Saccharopolyspora sp. HNM0983]
MSGGQNSVDGDVHGTAVQVGSADEVNLMLGGGAFVPVKPKTLPSDPLELSFANRTAELAELDRLCARARQEGRSQVALLHGMGGIGKTLTMLRFAHQEQDRFPDGVFYDDLGGNDPDGPRTPSEILSGFLYKLGVDGSAQPSTEKERGAAFRHLTADQQVLLVLDDAATAAQVLALLPSSSRSVVLVTARRELSFLSSRVASIPVEPFEPVAALDLLTERLGEEADGAGPELRALVEACGRHPYALQLAGRRLRGRSSLPTRANRIAQNPLTLDEDGEPRLKGQFDSAYAELGEQDRRTYRLLAAHPRGEFSLAAAAALLGEDVVDAEDRVDVLADLHLVTRVAPERYRFHSLSRAHAQGKLTADEDVEDRHRATARMVRHYLDFTMRRDAVLSARRRLNPDYAHVEPAHRGPDAHRTAVHELEAERGALPGVVRAAHEHGLHEQTWQLCEALFTFLVDRDCYEDLLEILPLATPSAQQLAAPDVEVRMRAHLGSAYFLAQDYVAARAQFELSLQLAEQCGDVLGRQSALEWLGQIHERLGDPQAALQYYDASREVVQQEFAPERRPRPLALHGMHSGRVLVDNGEPERALDRLHAAHECFAELGEQANPAKTALSIARARLLGHELDDADRWARYALDICREVRMVQDTAVALELLGEISARSGDTAAAAEHRREAGRLLSALGAERARALLDEQS